MRISGKILAFIFIFFSIFVAQAKDNDFKTAKNLDIYISMFKELNYNYVDNIDPEKLIQTSIDAMLESLDPYTTFIPESDLDDFKFQTTGQYGGIGSLIRKSGDYVVISEPYEGSPSYKAGMRAGDIIIAIDGKDIKGKDVSSVSEQLKGKPGTTVTVEIKRVKQSENLKIKITREKISIPSVPYYTIVKDSIGYIRLSGFTTDANQEVKEALEDLKENYHIKGLILDLRNNPGGLLNESVEISGLFLAQGSEVVSTKGKIEQYNKPYTTSSEPIDTTLPLAVLVNRSSASAAEIVCGSLQDYDRAVIVGQRTYGKGLVQTTRPLSYNTYLKVTTAKYYIPSGRCIQALDYSHRNEDGSVGYIPDTLISEFKTKHGRTVYDGGGVEPDVKVPSESLGNITYNLYSKNTIFDFATDYYYSHKDTPSLKQFVVNDSVYNHFIQYVNSIDFNYQSKSEEGIDKLIEIAKKEKYYASADSEFLMLKHKLAHDKTKDLLNFRPEIEHFISEELLTRYYNQKGRIQSAIEHDPEVDKACEVLNSPVLYSDILSGKAGELQAMKNKKGKGKATSND
jgi:carboxyl-terminal processing protease